jgi:ketosteroid isomerase-like protein
MERMRNLLVVVLLLALLSPLVAAQKTRSQTRVRREHPADAATAALLQMDRDFAKTGVAKNIDSFMSFIAEDVRFYAEGVMRTGKLAFREGWAKGFAEPNWSITWAPLYAEAGNSADLGYTTGSFEIHDKSSDGTPVVRKGSYVTIWRKQSDGTWKVALDMGSFVPPKPAAPAQPTGSQ